MARPSEVPNRTAENETLEELLLRGYRYALALTHDPSRSDDLVGDAVTAMISRDAPRHVGYLFRTIRNRFIDQYRRSKRVSFSPLEDAEGDPGLSVPIQPDPLVDREELEAALATLRPAEREAIYLVYIEDYTAREVAELTHRPRGTILSLLHRGRAKLRAHFEGIR